MQDSHGFYMHRKRHLVVRGGRRGNYEIHLPVSFNPGRSNSAGLNLEFEVRRSKFEVLRNTTGDRGRETGTLTRGVRLGRPQTADRHHRQPERVLSPAYSTKMIKGPLSDRAEYVFS